MVYETYFNKAVFFKKKSQIVWHRIRVTNCLSLPETGGFPGTGGIYAKTRKAPGKTGQVGHLA